MYIPNSVLLGSVAGMVGGDAANGGGADPEEEEGFDDWDDFTVAGRGGDAARRRPAK